MAPLLGVQLLVSIALGGTVLDGTDIAITHNEGGTWCDDGAGLAIHDDVSGDSAEVVYAGTAFQPLTVSYTKNKIVESHTGAFSTSSWDWTVADTVDGSMGADKSITHTLILDPGVRLEKTEHFRDTGRTIAISILLKNDSADELTNVRYYWAFDPDHDSAFATYNTLNDVRADGEWVSAIGPTSGWTVGIGICDVGSQEVGVTAWSTVTTATFTDPNGATADETIGFRANLGSIPAGSETSFTYLVSWDVTGAGAGAQFDDAVLDGACCDVDLDGHDGAVCGGDDCADFAEDIHPGVDEVFYDGLDSDCLGDDDYDADGDGDPHESYGGTDCDDQDATAFQDAVEWCDSVDNDCDGATDEADAVDRVEIYQDGDGDGYGTEAGARIVCDVEPGYVTVSGDCDDQAPTVHPDATEICDGLDNDCDGAVDIGAVGAPTWYQDSDGDGAGDAASSVAACNPPPGTVATAGDCDDTDPDVGAECSDTGSGAGADDVGHLAVGCGCGTSPGRGHDVLWVLIVTAIARRRCKEHVNTRV